MKPKFFLMTTVSMSLNFFTKQIKELHNIYDVTLISSPSSQLEEIAQREGVNYKGIEMKREISFLNDLKSLLNLIFLFYREKPYVLHCNTPKASLVGLLAAYITKVPNRIYYIHGFRYQGASGMKRHILINMEKIACFCATRIIAVSHGVKEIAQQEITSKNIDVIHNGSANGIDIDLFIHSEYAIEEIKSELNIAQNDFVFGFVGRIVGDKGINELIACFNELNFKFGNIKLILVGRYEDELDPLSNETKQLIKDNIHIIEVGFQKDVKKYLSIMDVLVSPSYREGFGLSLLEANLMGVPVIASHIIGYNEIVIEGKNGFLIPSKDKEALLQKMVEVYHIKSDLSKMKEFCINNVIQKFNHKDVLSEALSYYKSLLN